LIERIDILRSAFATVPAKHPFRIDAIVVLPDHLYCIWTLPPDDSDFSTRWGLIKASFSRHVTKTERISESRYERGERGLWQRRFWEHKIRDETDYLCHVEYIYWNPVKHGHARSQKEWPYSSFHDYVKQGIYPENWGAEIDVASIETGE
jgi:putative transposase